MGDDQEGAVFQLFWGNPFEAGRCLTVVVNTPGQAWGIITFTHVSCRVCRKIVKMSHDS